MAVDREFRIRFTGDATQLNESSKESAKNLEKLGDNTEEASKKAEKHNNQHRMMHKLLHQLNEIIPGLGDALKAMWNPANAGLIAVIAGLGTLIKLMDSWKEKAAEMRKLQAELAVATYEANQKAIESADEQLARIKEIQASSNKVKAIEEERLALMQEQYKVQLLLAGKDEAKKGFIEAQEQRRELALKESELKDAEARRDVLFRTQQDTLGGVQTSQAAADKAKVLLEDIGAKLLKAIEARQSAERAPLPLTVGIAPGMPGYGEAVKLAEDGRARKIEEARKKEDDLREAKEANEKVIREHTQDLKRNDEALKQYQAADEDVKRRREENNKASAVLDTKERGAVRAALQSAGVPDTFLTERLARGLSAERAAGKGLRLDSGQQEDATFLVNLIGTVNPTKSRQQIIQMVKKLQDDQTAFEEALKTLYAQMKNVRLNFGP
jgi:hypothetical protein